MGFNSVSFFVWNEKKVQRGCQTLNFFCSIDRRDRDNAFYGVFEFQTSTSLATPARQKKHIVANPGVQLYCNTSPAGNRLLSTSTVLVLVLVRSF